MEKEYESELYEVTKTFIYMILGFFSCFFMILFITKILHASVFIFMVALILLFITPFIFERRIKRLFIRKVLIKFDNNLFSISIFNFKKNKILKKLNINWNEIKSYKFYFAPSGNTVLTVYLKNGKTENWSFTDNKTEEEAFNTESIFKYFITYVNNFNLNTTKEDKIFPNKGFYNSQIGTGVLYFQLLVFLSGIIVHLMINPKTSIFTLLLSFSIVFQQFIKKKQEKSTYSKIMELNF